MKRVNEALGLIENVELKEVSIPGTSEGILG